MFRLASAVVSLVGVLSLAACGADDGGGSARSTPATATGPVSAAEPSDPRYPAIEDVLEAFVALGKLEGNRVPSYARADAVMRPVLSACNRLDRADPLLRALRDACRDVVDFFHNSLRPFRCRELELCAHLFEDMRASAKNLVASRRAADRAVGAAALPAACKRALRSSEGAYTFYRRLDARLKRLVDAIAFGFETDMEKAFAALARPGDDRLPSARASLEKFRAGCR